MCANLRKGVAMTVAPPGCLRAVKLGTGRRRFATAKVERSSNVAPVPSAGSSPLLFGTDTENLDAAAGDTHVRDQVTQPSVTNTIKPTTTTGESPPPASTHPVSQTLSKSEGSSRSDMQAPKKVRTTGT